MQSQASAASDAPYELERLATAGRRADMGQGRQNPVQPCLPDPILQHPGRGFVVRNQQAR